MMAASSAVSMKFSNSGDSTEGRSPVEATGAASATGSGSGEPPLILDLMTAPKIRTPYPVRMAPATVEQGTMVIDRG